MKVNDIYSFLNNLYPIDTAMEFDNPGMLVGDRNCEVSKALVSLDCNFDTVKIALEKGANLIITHHPVIFDGLKNVTDGSVVYELIKNGISVISMHTNLDIAEGGVNDELCRALELKNIEKITDDEDFILRKGSISPICADDLAKHIKGKLGGAVKYSAPDKEIKNVLVCSGSGGSYIYLAKSLGCDALITADVKHNIFIDAANLEIAVFDAGHFDTEDIIIEPLTSLLQKQFPDVRFLPCHHSRIKYV